MTVLIFSILFILFISIKDFLGDSAGKEFVCNVRDLGSILGWEDPLEKGTGTHSSILAWRIPWTKEPIGHKGLDTTQRLSLFKCRKRF